MFSTQSDALNGELVDLLTYLEVSYRETTQTHKNLSIPASAFLEWAKDHLTKHRPSEVFAVDNNYGILLTNGQRIKLCPDASVARTGDMANPDTSIPVTRLS